MTATEFVKRCQVFQYHRKFIRVTSKPLQATSHPWSSASWEIDIVGPFEKATAWEDQRILVSMDYYSKWAEVIAAMDFTMTIVTEFI